MKFELEKPKGKWSRHHCIELCIYPILIFKIWNVKGWLYWNGGKYCYKYQIVIAWLFWDLIIYFKKEWIDKNY